MKTRRRKHANTLVSFRSLRSKIIKTHSFTEPKSSSWGCYAFVDCLLEMQFKVDTRIDTIEGCFKCPEHGVVDSRMKKIINALLLINSATARLYTACSQISTFQINLGVNHLTARRKDDLCPRFYVTAVPTSVYNFVD